jgi:hypothetical protein
MNPAIEAIFADLDHRMESMAPTACFLDLTGKSRKFGAVDIPLFGFCLLRFMYERMLVDESPEFVEVQQFITELIPRLLSSSSIEGIPEDFAHILFFEILQNQGRPWEFPWKNPAAPEERSLPIRLIILEKDFEVGKAARYRLSPQGLNFLFQTREFHMEAMVSIEQLFLRRQLEKGNFAGALERLGGLSLLIRQLDGEMRDMIERAAMNALRIPFERYRDLHRRVYEQFDQERDEFESQRKLLNQRRTILERPGVTLSTRDLESLQLLIKTQQELDRLMGDHNHLFQRKQELQTAYRKALENQFANGFRSRLNIETEILDRGLKGTIALDAFPGFIRPFISTKLRKMLNLNACFTERCPSAEAAGHQGNRCNARTAKWRPGH